MSNEQYQIQVAKDKYGWVWVILDAKGFRKDYGATNTKWGAFRQARKAAKALKDTKVYVEAA